MTLTIVAIGGLAVGSVLLEKLSKVLLVGETTMRTIEILGFAVSGTLAICLITKLIRIINVI